MRLPVEIPPGVLPRIWRKWEKVEAIKLEQGDHGRITLLVSYDAAESARAEFEAEFGEAA